MATIVVAKDDRDLGPSVFDGQTQRVVVPPARVDAQDGIHHLNKAVLGSDADGVIVKAVHICGRIGCDQDAHQLRRPPQL